MHNIGTRWSTHENKKMTLILGFLFILLKFEDIGSTFVRGNFAENEKFLPVLVEFQRIAIKLKQQINLN